MAVEVVILVPSGIVPVAFTATEPNRFAPTPDANPFVAPVSVTIIVSVGSGILSSITRALIMAEVSPCPKSIVPFNESVKSVLNVAVPVEGPVNVYDTVTPPAGAGLDRFTLNLPVFEGSAPLLRGETDTVVVGVPEFAVTVKLSRLIFGRDPEVPPVPL